MQTTVDTGAPTRAGGAVNRWLAVAVVVLAAALVGLGRGSRSTGWPGVRATT